MTDRIKAVCSLIGDVDSLADIGCYDGVVARFAAEKGVKTVIAADVSAEAIRKAERNLRGFSGVMTVVTDGFTSLPRVDTAVISGMGGKTVVSILKGCDYHPTLILSAQSNQAELRIYLTENGYVITHDACVEDGDRFYDVIRAEKGESAPLTLAQAQFGVFCDRPSDALKKRLSRERARLNSFKRQTKETKNRLLLLDEVEKWQK